MIKPKDMTCQTMKNEFYGKAHYSTRTLMYNTEGYHTLLIGDTQRKLMQSFHPLKDIR